MSSFCAIDFGTTNSALALPGTRGMELAEIEAGYRTIPTAVFYSAEDSSRCFGREAVAAYVDGFDGRLMRCIKSILGSDLMERETEIGFGLTVRYIDVVRGFLRHLKTVAEAQSQTTLEHAILGRPVYFVDDDPARDARAQAVLEQAARTVGFKSVAFQFEPIAAALEYESRVEREELVLVVDAGGGTSDFSLVRVGPGRRERLDRRDDILGNHGVHIAGTDFDQAVSLKRIMPLLGMGTPGTDGRNLPHSIYFDLATWHLINTCYSANRVIELRQLAWLYGDTVFRRRLMRVLTHRLGHHLAARAEEAKIAVALEGVCDAGLDAVEDGLRLRMDAQELDAVLERMIARIGGEAAAAARMAGVRNEDVDVIYFTGGSSKLDLLARAVAQYFPAARHIHGDPFASVASGLGIYARRVFAA
jgi:hypothetical chaperone protein